MSILDGTGLTPQPAGITADNPGRGSMSARSFWQELRNNPRSLFYAVLMHLLLFLALVLNLDWKTSTDDSAQGGVIKAQVVDSAKVQAEVSKLKQAAEIKVQQEENRKQELERAAQQAEQRRVQEEEKLSQVQQQQAVEQQKLEQQKLEQKQLEQQLATQQKLEAERQSRLKIKQAEAEKQAKLKKEQEAKAAQQRAAEEEKKKAAAQEEKKKAAAEAKRKQDEAKQKAAAEKKAQAAAAAKQQQEAERAMQDQLDAEMNALQSSGRNQSEIGKYTSAIKQAVQNNWLQPTNARPGMQCTVRVNLIPGGDVAGVRIVVSSGDAAFDRSVENAVRKAAPLPLPSDPGLFNNFRELTFVFKPEN